MTQRDWYRHYRDVLNYSVTASLKAARRSAKLDRDKKAREARRQNAELALLECYRDAAKENGADTVSIVSAARYTLTALRMAPEFVAKAIQHSGKVS
jgi:hypothetical protein